jgi:phosphomannomutase/phosphoglucomutase
MKRKKTMKMIKSMTGLLLVLMLTLSMAACGGTSEKEGENKELVSNLQKAARFDDAEDVILIDGVRIEFKDGFALARSSNTTPVVVLRLEGDNEQALERIKKRFGEFLLSVEPSLKLPF